MSAVPLLSPSSCVVTPAERALLVSALRHPLLPKSAGMLGLAALLVAEPEPTPQSWEHAESEADRLAYAVAASLTTPAPGEPPRACGTDGGALASSTHPVDRFYCTLRSGALRQQLLVAGTVVVGVSPAPAARPGARGGAHRAR